MLLEHFDLCPRSGGTFNPIMFQGCFSSKLDNFHQEVNFVESGNDNLSVESQFQPRYQLNNLGHSSVTRFGHFATFGRFFKELGTLFYPYGIFWVNNSVKVCFLPLAVLPFLKTLKFNGRSLKIILNKWTLLQAVLNTIFNVQC